MEFKPVTCESIGQFSDAYNGCKMNRVMTDIFSKNDFGTFGFDPNANKGKHFRFSYEIPTMRSTNQKSSGRCWLFAATNVLREIIGKKLNVDYFELSQSYLAFWDKFERCNYYLNCVIDTANDPIDDRTVQYIIGNTFGGDGGQWDMFANIVKKYGIVPKDAMPETFQTSATGRLNGYLSEYMRVCAFRLRNMIAGGASETEVDAAVKDILGRVYSFLCRCYTEPPKKFDLEYTDKDKKYHMERDYTPESFKDKFIGDFLDNYISVIHAPTADKPFGKFYTVKYLGNIVGGDKILYYNVPMDEFKALAVQQLKDGEVVWFGSDCGKFCDRDKRLWDDKSFDNELITGLDSDYTKAESLDYRISAMNHAMVLTGFNIDERTGKTDRWKIQNSWGSDGVNEGYYFCTDSWFERFVYQIVINKKYLKGKLDDIGEITELAPWDPMGTLAD